MEDCYIIDKYGAIKLNILEEIDLRYLGLKCVIHGKLHTQYMYYPYISASNPQKYLTKIKIILDAMKAGLKYIKTADHNNNNDEYSIVFYKDDKYKSNAILYGYLTIKYVKMMNDPYNPIEYILHTLAGYEEEYSRRFYLARYIHNTDIKGFVNNKNVSMKNKYMQKYELIERNDNFKKFNDMYEEIKKQAGKIIEMTKKSKDFKTFIENTKIEDFKFIMKESIGDNPMYKEVESDVKIYAKKIGVRL